MSDAGAWANLLTMLESFSRAIGALVVAGGVPALAAYALFRFLGEKWLSTKFEEKMAAYRHAQTKELEGLKLRLNTLFDRTIKLHQKEFDVLPECWAKLCNEYWEVRSVTSRFQQYPNVDGMTSEQLDEFLEQSPLLNWQKAELRTQPKKLQYYQKAIGWHRLSKARDLCRDFSIYFSKNGIFIPEDLKDKFKMMDEIIWGALVEHETNMEIEGFPKVHDSLEKLGKEGAKLFSELEAEVRRHLWNSSKLDDAAL